MPRYLKTPEQKLETRLAKLVSDPMIKRKGDVFKVRRKKIMSIEDDTIRYGIYRYLEKQKDDIIQENYSVDIPISHENLEILGTNIINPPNGARRLVEMLGRLTNTRITYLEIGSSSTRIYRSQLYISKQDYLTIIQIDREEKKRKTIRTDNRVIPLLNTMFSLNLNLMVEKRDYSLILKEIIATGELSREDVLGLVEKLDSGEVNQVVIKKQIDKQVEWLIDTIEELLEETNLTLEKARRFGKENFGYLSTEVSGQEKLIEKILTDFGRNTLFGVPALLNINNYVVNAKSQSRSQFDLLLINHIGDIEVVELKRTDEVILAYDSNRNKFYPAKILSIAIAQAERYVSAVTSDNDEDYKINGKKIREFLNDELGNTMFVEAIRPKALVIIGSWKTVAKPYNNLTSRDQAKISEDNYSKESLRAYQEIRSAYKNINILNYSEILEHARTRLSIS